MASRHNCEQYDTNRLSTTRKLEGGYMEGRRFDERQEIQPNLLNSLLLGVGEGYSPEYQDFSAVTAAWSIMRCNEAVHAKNEISTSLCLVVTVA